MLRRFLLVLTIVLLPVAAAACNGDGDGGDDDTSPTAETTARSSTPAASPSRSATTAATAGSGATPAVEGVVDRADGDPWTEAHATALLDAALLEPADLPLGPWLLQTDTRSNNADAAQANPESAASNERCGRLLARTTVNQVEDAITAFIAGETLSFFSTATVYETEAGADDCSAESATRLAEPGALARAFGPLFIDPDAVQIALADFPPVIEGQFAATLTGQIDAAGTVIDLTLLIVAFQSENVTATVGSARSGSTPPADELQEFVELVLARIQANQ
ncbi:MAG: hypothetical protein WEB52_03340 [Dehalococcoidia bacterium]